MECAFWAMEQFQALLQARPFTLQISPWSGRNTKPRPEKMLHKICQALAKFSIWVKHQTPPGATLPIHTHDEEDPNLFVQITRTAKSPEGNQVLLQIHQP
jgi:hypothetical protein